MEYWITVDVVAYVGTGIIFASSLIPRRAFLHLGVAFGSSLWLVYGGVIGSMPLVVTEALSVLIQLIAAWRFRHALRD